MPRATSAKGSPVAVLGRISSEFWERTTDDGKKSQLTTEVVVERIDFLGPPIHAATAAPQQPAARGGKAA